jgi:hypothetical protein
MQFHLGRGQTWMCSGVAQNHDRESPASQPDRVAPATGPQVYLRSGARVATVTCQEMRGSLVNPARTLL